MHCIESFTCGEAARSLVFLLSLSYSSTAKDIDLNSHLAPREAFLGSLSYVKLHLKEYTCTTQPKEFINNRLHGKCACSQTEPEEAGPRDSPKKYLESDIALNIY